MTPRTLTALIFICLATLVAPASATSTDPSRSRIALAEITDGATLDGLLAEMGLLRNQRANIANAPGRSISPRKLRPGQWLAVRFGDDAETFDALVVHLGRGRRAVVTKQDTGYSSDLFDPDNSDIERTERFKIKRSLAKDAQDSGVPNAVIAQLTQALDTHVDFSRDVHGGEAVRITFNEHYTGSGKPTQSDLVFAKIVLRRYSITVARDEDGNWVVDRETPLGGLFRRPVDVAHITSGFGPRKHPVLGVWRQHNGIDYAAPHGTPVYASAPGRVTFVGHQRGYGRLIEIRHSDGLSTRYAHLAGFVDGLERDQIVGVGAHIGSVGQSGTATGPNLHFEILHNGVAVDPLETSIALVPPIDRGNQVARTD